MKQEPQVVAIAAHKGGVGKTTTAVSLAAGLAKYHEANVLLVDLDPQGHAGLGIGFDLAEEERNHTVRELFVDEPAPIETLIHPVRKVERVWILPASIRLERVAQALVGRPMRHAVLAAALRPLLEARRFDWILIDCPPSLGPLVENALCAADAVIVPCIPEARAVDGLADLVEVLQLLRPGFQQWRVLQTRRRKSATRTNSAADRKLEHYESSFLRTVVPDCEAFKQAQFIDEDIYAYDGGSTGATAYLQLCEELEAWVGRTETSSLRS